MSEDERRELQASADKLDALENTIRHNTQIAATEAEAAAVKERLVELTRKQEAGEQTRAEREELLAVESKLAALEQSIHQSKTIAAADAESAVVKQRIAGADT